MICNPQIYLVFFLLNLPDGKAASVSLEQPPVNLNKNSSRPTGRQLRQTHSGSGVSGGVTEEPHLRHGGTDGGSSEAQAAIATSRFQNYPLTCGAAGEERGCSGCERDALTTAPPPMRWGEDWWTYVSQFSSQLEA